VIVRRAPLVVALAVLAACDGVSPAPAVPETPAQRSDPLAGLAPWSDPWVLAHASIYLDGDTQAPRRAALERSLASPENLYSRARLGAYARPRGGWDALPEWQPRAIPIDAALAAALARGERPELAADRQPFVPAQRPETLAEWAAIGERVFFELPLRSEPFWESAIRDPARADALGIERATDGSFPGLVWMRDLDGRGVVGITCALCHSARSGDVLVAGRARRRLDYGRARIGFFEARRFPIDPRDRARWESWGPGRADVLEEEAEIPIAIPDLWGLREQRLLTQAGTLRHEDPLALAIRQETQYIQANHHHTRPPRVLMFALAMYLYSLTPPPARREAGDAGEREAGAVIFASECGRCHRSAIGSGELVPIAEIATDPELATGHARGTGGYRPAPLVRVADAAPYLHHGAVATLEDLLDPARSEQGHRFGMELAGDERARLLAYLRTR
jgi:mono/diheme cytochrome c family protein